MRSTADTRQAIDLAIEAEDLAAHRIDPESRPRCTTAANTPARRRPCAREGPK